MQELIEAFDERLRGLFEAKAAEFSRHAEEEPTSSMVTSQLAGLYRELADTLSH